MTRILSAARIQLIAWPERVRWPWLVLAIAFGANLAIFAAIVDRLTDNPSTGGLASIYIVEMIYCAQSITQVLPFALGLSLTRRSFYAAALLLVVARSTVFGTALWLLKLVEDATNGWGLSLSFFGVGALAQDNPVLQILSYVMLFVLISLVGIIGGVAFKRWGLNGMFTLLSATVVLLVGVVVLLTWQHQWGHVRSWLDGQSSLALIAGWPTVLALGLAGSGFLMIRRATPR